MSQTQVLLTQFPWVEQLPLHWCSPQSMEQAGPSNPVSQVHVSSMKRTIVKTIDVEGIRDKGQRAIYVMTASITQTCTIETRPLSWTDVICQVIVNTLSAKSCRHMFCWSSSHTVNSCKGMENLSCSGSCFLPMTGHKYMRHWCDCPTIKFRVHCNRCCTLCFFVSNSQLLPTCNCNDNVQRFRKQRRNRDLNTGWGTMVGSKKDPPNLGHRYRGHLVGRVLDWCSNAIPHKLSLRCRTSRQTLNHSWWHNLRSDSWQALVKHHRRNRSVLQSETSRQELKKSECQCFEAFLPFAYVKGTLFHQCLSSHLQLQTFEEDSCGKQSVFLSCLSRTAFKALWKRKPEPDVRSVQVGFQQCVSINDIKNQTQNEESVVTRLTILKAEVLLENDDVSIPDTFVEIYLDNNLKTTKNIRNILDRSVMRLHVHPVQRQSSSGTPCHQAANFKDNGESILTSAARNEDTSTGFFRRRSGITRPCLLSGIRVSSLMLLTVLMLSDSWA